MTQTKKAPAAIQQPINPRLLPWLALLAGTWSSLAFAPKDLHLVAWLAGSILLYSVTTASRKQAFWRGYLFGLGFYASTVYWIFIAIHTYGKTPSSIAFILTALLIAGFALFDGLRMLCCATLARRNAVFLACYFCVFTLLFEWIRSHLFTGFPWNLLGYSQIHGLLDGFIPLFGVYGLSLITTLLSGLVYLLLFAETLKKKLIALGLFVLILIVASTITKKMYTHPIKNKGATVALVQGNIQQSLKWDPSQISQTLNTYSQLTKDQFTGGIVIWPESAIPVLPRQIPDYIDALNQQAKQSATALAIGIPTAQGKPLRYHNSIITLGDAQGRYAKQHLVPFGEYVPLQWISKPLYQWMHIPMSVFSPGKGQNNIITLKGIPTSVFICYEIIFPAMALEHADQSQLLLTISDDAWFGDSIALNQHLAMAAFHARALGRYMLFSTNTGITAIINPLGKIIAQAPKDKATVLQGHIIPMQGKTPFMRWHNGPTWISILLLFLITLYASHVKPRTKRGE